MSRRRAIYIDRDAPNSEPGRRRPRGRGIALVVLVLIVLAVTSLLWLMREQRQRAAAILPDFRVALEAGDYSAALSSYHEAQEKALSQRLFAGNREQYEAAVTAMEEAIHQRMGELVEGLLEGRVSALSADEARFFEEMNELGLAYLREQSQVVIRRVLLGERTSAQARHLFRELASIPRYREAMDRLSANLPQMQLASEAFAEAVALADNEDYYQAIDKLRELVKDPAVYDEGPTAEVIASETAAIKERMRPHYLDEIQRLMARGRHVTASARIEALLNYFEKDSELLALYEQTKGFIPGQLVRYTGAIRQLAIKPLIVDTGIAFSGNAVSATADQTMITVNEFRAMLELLYARNYILLDQSTLMDESGLSRPIYLPAGKRALILTIDGLNYYPARRLSGNCTNLVLDEEGHVAGVHIDRMGQPIVEREAEAIGILDAFVEAHPDFSFDGAKGTIAVSGRYGLFGYALDEAQLAARNAQAMRYGVPAEMLDAQALEKNRADCSAVVAELLASGWTFASFSYGGDQVTELSLDELKADTDRWLSDIAPITGDTAIYIYPNGYAFRGQDARKSYLMEKGFMIFGGLGPRPYVAYQRGYYFMDRLFIGGYALRQNLTSAVFDGRQVYDPARTVPMPNPTPTPVPVETTRPVRTYPDRTG